MSRDVARVSLPVDAARRRGRGATVNPAVRHDRLHRERVEDGWDIPEEAPPLGREITIDRARSVLTRNASPDLPFDRSVNPYRGCEHGCVYCYARPSHADLGFSPGLEFETRLVVKPEAPERLAEALARPGYRPATIAIGTNTDPYQPIEREHRVMRGLLACLADARHPVAITTKGALILRDLDLLAGLARDGLVSVTVSLTTLDHRLHRALEPRAAAPGRRLAAIEALAGAGVPVGVNIAPVIPALNEAEIERLLGAAAGAGAAWAWHVVLRLPREVHGIFRDWLAEQYPDRAARVMRRVAEMHGGRDYDPRFGLRMTGQGVAAQLVARRMAAGRARHALASGPLELRTDLFRPAPGPGGQLAFDFAG